MSTRLQDIFDQNMKVQDFCYQIIQDNMAILHCLAKNAAEKQRNTTNFLHEFTLKVRNILNTESEKYQSIYAYCEKHFNEILAFLRELFNHQFALCADEQFTKSLVQFHKDKINDYNKKQALELIKQPADMIGANMNGVISQTSFLLQIFLREIRMYFYSPQVEPAKIDWWQQCQLNHYDLDKERLKIHDSLLQRVYLLPTKITEPTLWQRFCAWISELVEKIFGKKKTPEKVTHQREDSISVATTIFDGDKSESEVSQTYTEVDAALKTNTQEQWHTISLNDETDIDSPNKPATVTPVSRHSNKPQEPVSPSRCRLHSKSAHGC